MRGGRRGLGEWSWGKDLRCSEVERRENWRIALINYDGRILRRARRSDRKRFRLRFDFARVDRREHRRLCDQLSLGLAKDLVLVKAKEEKTYQRKDEHARDHARRDHRERWAPLVARRLHEVKPSIGEQ